MRRARQHRDADESRDHDQRHQPQQHHNEQQRNQAGYEDEEKEDSEHEGKDEDAMEGPGADDNDVDECRNRFQQPPDEPHGLQLLCYPAAAYPTRMSLERAALDAMRGLQPSATTSSPPP